MPKKCIDFITRRTSQQTKLNTIGLRHFFHIIRDFSPNLHRREKATYQDHPTQKNKFPFHKQTQISTRHQHMLKYLNNS